ncbi:MAG: penicillin-binding protein 2 [Candidatus Magasanikbacteria bacterium]|nr:penicillin-binding protein 2 [Candidatus Magasanikbacteria bacterium]
MVKSKAENSGRLGAAALFFLLLAIIIVARLFWLQIVEHKYYALLAADNHEIFEKLQPERGSLWWQDTRTKETFPAAINKKYYLVYGVPREIPRGELASTTAQVISILHITDATSTQMIVAKLAQATSKYRPLAKKVSEEIVSDLKAARLTGIYTTAQEFRFYPEESLGGNVLGFVGSDKEGNLVGRYGLEGYFEKELAGEAGFLAGEKGALGNWIALGQHAGVAAKHGADLVLTLDRTLEYKACERLQQGMVDYAAKSAALVLMNADTGAILAMCSLPDFDPNNYSKVDNVQVYNNTAIFTPYEPGSVFKTMTMAAGLDLGIVTPATTYTDPCERTINGYRIRNAEGKCYGKQTMTEVLEKSINTGALWVEEKMGNEKFAAYVKKFGFGERTGITMATEAIGDISSLSKAGQIFGANGSFGQGITAIPLQIAGAYGAIANGGQLMKPYIVEETRYADGQRERASPQVVERVMSSRSASLLTGMLVSVVENHYHSAKIDHYYVAGKTGTAQIPERGHYSAERTNHTFAGFAPVKNPHFVLVVKYEEPDRQWAESTALPVFKDVMQFTLNYYGVPAER